MVISNRIWALIKECFMQPLSSASHAPSRLAALPKVMQCKVAAFIVDPTNYFSTKAIFYVSKEFRKQEDDFIEQVAIRDLVVGCALRKAEGELENMSPRFQEFIKKVRKSVQYLSLSGIPVHRHVLRTITKTCTTVLGCRKVMRTLSDQRICLNPSPLSRIFHIGELTFAKIIQQRFWFFPLFIAKREIIPQKERVYVRLLPELLRLFPSIKTVDTGDFNIYLEDCQSLSMCRQLSTVKVGSNNSTSVFPQRSTPHLTFLLDTPSLTDLDISALGDYYVPPVILFEKMGRLRSLSMMVNIPSQDYIIQNIAKLRNLERLTTKGYNTFSNQDLIPLGDFPQLREVSLEAGIVIRGEEPFFFAPLTKLEKLSLLSIDYQIPRFAAKPDARSDESIPVIDLGQLLTRHEKLREFVIRDCHYHRVEFTLSSPPQQAALEKLFLFGHECSTEMLQQCASLSSLSALACKVFFEAKQTEEYEALACIQSLKTLLITGLFRVNQMGIFRKGQLEKMLHEFLNALKKLPHLQTFGLYLPDQEAIREEVERIVKASLPDCKVHVVTEREVFKDLPEFFLSQI